MKVYLTNGDSFTVIKVWFAGNAMFYQKANGHTDHVDRNAVAYIES